jgi:hypothetical protein
MTARVTVALLLTVALTAPARADGPSAADVELFERKVRPLFSEVCQECHSTKTKQRGGLVLDSRAALLKGGETGPAIVPGAPEKSLLIRLIGYTERIKMPPRSRLSDEQIADLTEWVRRGAPWPDDRGAVIVAKEFDLEKRKQHWSLQPLWRGQPPAVKDKSWGRNPLDAFILAKLEAAGLRPAPPAERRALLRRVTFDLTGLPPTPQEIDAFLADTSADAYEKVVDRLLASPAYGERWGRHWLDLVRFAETSGHEFDFDMPEAHLYRDYVIRALNADVPYDQFVREHLAGDLLPTPRRHPVDGTNESILGTGFWFLGESKHSPVDLRADGADRRDNMIDVFGKTFLGMTLACARCHDHKFDAVPTRDYYSLVSYLQSSRQQRAFLDPPERISRPAAEMRRLQEEARRLAVGRAAKVLHEQLAALPSALLGEGGMLKANRIEQRRRDWAPGHLYHVFGLLDDPRAPAEQFAAKRRALVADLKARAARAAEGRKQYDLFEGFRGGYRGWFVTGDAFGDRPAGPADAVIDTARPQPVVQVPAPGAHSGLTSGRLQGALRSRTFTIEKKYVLYRVSGRGARVNLIIDGFQQIRDPIYGGLTFELTGGDKPRWHAQDVSMWVGLKGYVEVLDDGNGFAGLEQVLFSDQPRPPEESADRFWLRFLDDESLTDRAALAKKYGVALGEIVAQWHEGKLLAQDDAAERLLVLNALLADDLLALLKSPTAAGPDDDLTQIAALLDKAAAIETTLPAPRRGMAMADGTTVHERVHIRGNHRNLGPEAPPHFLEAIAGAEQPAAVNSGRLELAERLLAANDPLARRVIVNRLWQHHFGEGLVRSVDDFGKQGQPPTHPELLDFLAAELERQGWSLKNMHRLMVTSAAYRMASRGDEAAVKADPLNKLLHRMPVRRLEAEAIRDAMLAVSGRLDRRVYGPGPLPYLTPFMVGRGRPGASGPLDGDGRRSIYLNVRRNFLNPMFLAFDYPVPFTTIGKRTVSNVPAQALTLLNNPFVAQQAKLWAERALAEPGLDDAGRVARMYEMAFGRPPAKEELADALGFLTEQGREYGEGGEARAWADLAHVLFNVKEFVFVP